MRRYEQRVTELDPYYGKGRNAQSLSEATITVLEQRLGSTLSRDYREFLANFGGVTFLTSPFFAFHEANNPNSQDTLDAFYGILPDDPLRDIVTLYEGYRGRIPSPLLPIGEDPGGNIICLGLRGDRRGNVYFWDHEREEMPPDDAPSDWEPGYSNVSFIANSFDEFFFSLQPQE